MKMLKMTVISIEDYVLGITYFRFLIFNQKHHPQILHLETNHIGIHVTKTKRKKTLTGLVTGMISKHN